MNDKKIYKLLKGFNLEDVWVYERSEKLDETKSVSVLVNGEEKVVEREITLEDRNKELIELIKSYNRLVKDLKNAQQYHSVLLSIFEPEEE